MSPTFTKRTVGRPAQWEAAGLAWLAERTPHGGAAVATVLRIDDAGLTETAIDSTPPSADAAERFGRALARTHEIDGASWGAGPTGWEGSGYQGPNEHLLELELRPHQRWGAMYADDRIAPLVDCLDLEAQDRAIFASLCSNLRQGEFDTDDVPARLHGDLWSGNLLWSAEGCVLIDPAAHVGHRESDLAALALFGCPHLDRIVGSYDEVRPLADGWRERVELHQISMLLMHAVVFGGSYVGQSVAAAQRYVGRR